MFEVNPESAESKLDDGEDFLAVGLDQEPGFPLSSLSAYIPQGVTYPGDPSTLQRPLYSLLSATLVTFDRGALRAVVRISARDAALIPFIRRSTNIPLDGPIFLVPSRSFYDPSAITRAILEDVGNPAVANPDPNAARAMAQARPNVRGNDPITPAAEVLWNPPGLQARQVRTPQAAATLVTLADNLQGLNASQKDAVRDAVSQGLTIIWGPPGTGKTKTLVAIVHALAREASDRGAGRNILISGPTYKAVEELMGRLLDSLSLDQRAAADVYLGYSRYRDVPPLRAVPQNLTAKSMKIDQADRDWGACLASVTTQNRVTIFGTTIHQVHKMAKDIGGTFSHELFDLVILDESSQIPVSRSLAAFSAMKTGGQLVVAGDHLQMPPIAALEPPLNSEYLVGSVQSYLLKRQFGSPVRASELLENYRSGQHLVDFARTIGYPVGLSSAYPGTVIHLLGPIAPLASSMPASLPWSDEWASVLDPVFSTVTLLHEDDLSSQSSEFEAKIVGALVFCLRGRPEIKLSDFSHL